MQPESLLRFSGVFGVFGGFFFPPFLGFFFPLNDGFLVKAIGGKFGRAMGPKDGKLMKLLILSAKDGPREKPPRAILPPLERAFQSSSNFAL